MSVGVKINILCCSYLYYILIARALKKENVLAIFRKLMSNEYYYAECERLPFF